MTDAVKGTRRYHSPRRAEQAAATRREILDAAQRLFVRQGYGATSMAAIAREAGVATKTVYLAFETKSGLLRAVWNRALRGERDEIPVGEQDWFQAVMDEPDPERQVAMNARNATMVKRRAGDVAEVVRSAASSDPDVGALWERIQSEFHATQRKIVKSLHAKGALKRGLGVERGTDLMWTLNHPAVWQLLVGERGWTPEQYERWLAESFREQLLGR
jgi:AcrR family transcriptional regulator